MQAALVGKTIGFIGAGAMASAMMQGLLNAGVAQEAILASDPWSGSREKAQALGIAAMDDNVQVARQADVIVLAVKPHIVEAALQSIAQEMRSQLVVSIAAGVMIDSMAASCPPETRIVRTMPNTPCLVGEAAVGVSRGPFATDDDVAVAKALFTGVCVEVPENNLDAVTAISGSSPAYTFLYIEALADAGVRAGLSRAVSLQLAAQAVKGAAAMQIKTGTHPAVLKDQVCSPGGTTIAAVEALEKNGFRYAAMSAVSACAQRAKEMAEATTVVKNSTSS